MIGIARTLFFLGCLAMMCGCGSSNSTVTPITPPTSTPSAKKVEHIVVVMMQNASFDHLFGTFPGVEGIRSGVPGYEQVDASGATVTPYLLTTLSIPPLPEGKTAFTNEMNGGKMDRYAATAGKISMGYFDGATPGVDKLWSYAQQYALADNYFSSGIGEAPTNQLYLVSASSNGLYYSYQPNYGPCAQADTAVAPPEFENVADQLAAKSLTWASYQQGYEDCSAYMPLHDPFQFFTSTHASGGRRNFSSFTTDISSGNMAAVSFVFPDNDHDMHPGYGPVSAGGQFVDDLVKTVQSSKYWDTTAILVTWDTGGSWYDHVPPPQVDAFGLGSRVPLLVVSPLAKKSYISNVQLDHVSILRFIQTSFGLSTLNERNSQSADLSDLFQ